MIKKLFLVTILLSAITTSANAFAGRGASRNSTKSNQELQKFRVLPISGYVESASLPPELFVNIELACNQKFLKLIRFDQTQPRTQKMVIVVGALVSEAVPNCRGQSQTLVTDAGTTFSGRDFEVQSISN